MKGSLGPQRGHYPKVKICCPNHRTRFIGGFCPAGVASIFSVMGSSLLSAMVKGIATWALRCHGERDV